MQWGNIAFGGSGQTLYRTSVTPGDRSFRKRGKTVIVRSRSPGPPLEGLSGLPLRAPIVRAGLRVGA
jgi:hypothetical protein